MSAIFKGSGQGLAASWESESPFVDASQREERLPAARVVVAGPAESPFVHEYDLHEGMLSIDPEAEEAAELMGELHSEAFDEVANELVHEVAGVAAPHLGLELGESAGQEARVAPARPP